MQVQVTSTGFLQRSRNIKDFTFLNILGKSLFNKKSSTLLTSAFSASGDLRDVVMIREVAHI